jgi:heme exporter protein A
LRDVSLAIPRGSVIMLAGRNGSGKSTLLRVLATVIRADYGAARVAGYDVRTDRHEVRKRWRSRPSPYHCRGAHGAREPKDSGELPERPGDDAGWRSSPGWACHPTDDLVSTFSAGMRKRLVLVCVLLQDLAVALLDEPYGELDPPGFHLLDHVIGELRKTNATVLMATHLLDRGRTLCDRALVLAENCVA